MLLQGFKKRPIYDREEADKLGIKYKRWQDMPHDKGDWVLTDDDKVVQVFLVSHRKRYEPTNRKFDWYKTAIGAFNFQCKIFSYANFKRKGNTFNGGKRKNYLTTKEKFMAEMILNGMNPLEATKAIWPNWKRISEKYNYVVQSEVFLKYMQERVMKNHEEVLKKAGIEPDDLLRTIKRIANSDKALDNPKYAEVALKALTGLLALHGIVPEHEKPKVVTAIQAVKETHFSKSLLNELEGEKEGKQLMEVQEVKKALDNA